MCVSKTLCVRMCICAHIRACERVPVCMYLCIRICVCEYMYVMNVSGCVWVPLVFKIVWDFFEFHSSWRHRMRNSFALEAWPKVNGNCFFWSTRCNSHFCFGLCCLDRVCVRYWWVAGKFIHLLEKVHFRPFLDSSYSIATMDQLSLSGIKYYSRAVSVP